MSYIEFILLFVAIIFIFSSISQLDIPSWIYTCWEAAVNSIQFLFSPDFLESMAKILAEIAWPLAILIIAYIFKKEVSERIKNSDLFFKIGDSALSLKRQQKSDEANSNLKNITSSLNGEESKKIINQNEAQSATQLLPIVEHYLKLLKPIINLQIQNANMDKTNWLEASLVEYHIAISFERIYQGIYGSQIKALQLLESRINGLASIAEIRFLYNLAASSFPEFYKNDHFERWLSYLTKEALVSAENDNIRLNLEGFEFLKYIRQRGYYLEKAL